MIDFAKGAVNIVTGYINGLIANVESGINAIINMINSLSFDVPDWVPVFRRGKSSGLICPMFPCRGSQSLPREPLSRQTGSFWAVLGDQKTGTNIETPLETMVQAFEQALQRNSGRRDGDIYLQVDGQTFARIMQPYFDRNNLRKGAKLIEGVIR